MASCLPFARRVNLRVAITLAAGIFLFATRAPSVVLDWSALSWTPGSLTNSYDIDASNPGNDITIAVSGDTQYLRTDNVAPNPQTPDISTEKQGGYPLGALSLLFEVDYTNRFNSITITVSFNYAQGVSLDSATIFDIDLTGSAPYGFQDEVRKIWGTGIGGTNFGPNIIVSNAVTRTGSGTNQILTGTAGVPDTGAGSGAGNAILLFTNQPITGFTFTYGSSTAAQTDPVRQGISLYNMQWRPAPEIGVGFVPVALGVLAALTLVGRRHSRGH